jgi:hypothetical protein
MPFFTSTFTMVIARNLPVRLDLGCEQGLFINITINLSQTPFDVYRTAPRPEI